MPWELDFPLEAWRTCVGHYEINPPIYEKLIEKNKCICTNDKLENGLIYLYYAFGCYVMNASTTYTIYNSQI